MKNIIFFSIKFLIINIKNIKNVIPGKNYEIINYENNVSHKVFFEDK